MKSRQSVKVNLGFTFILFFWGGLVRVSLAKPLMLAFLFFGLLTSAAIAATTISINAGGGISGGSGATYVSSCDSDITMSAQTIMNQATSKMEVATISVGGLDMRYPEGCGGNVLDLTYLLNGIPTFASFNIPNTGVSSGTFILSSPSNTCNQSNSTLTSFSAATLSSISIAPNFSNSYQSASAYSGTSIVSSNLVVNLNASTYSGSGNWSNTGSAGGVATPYLNPAYTSFGSGSCFSFTTIPNYPLSKGSQRITIANPLSTNMTIGVWFKMVDLGEGSGSTRSGGKYRFWDTSFLVDGDEPNAADFGLGITDGHIVWGTGCSGGSCDDASDVQAISNATYNDGIWHYVAVTRSTSSQNLAIYVDGAIVTITQNGNSSSNPSYTLNGQNTLGIGGEKNGGREYFGNKSIAAVHMYDRVLSGSEILQNYNALKSNFGRS